MLNLVISNTGNHFRTGAAALALLAAVALPSFSGASETPLMPVFREDFTTFNPGPFPGTQSSDWSETENPGRTFITDFEGFRGLTFNTPPEERTRLMRPLALSDSAEEVVVRFAIRFPASTSNNGEMNSQFVPTFVLFGEEGQTGEIRLAFQSWGRIRVITLHPDTGTQGDFNLDSSRNDGVGVYVGTNYFEDYTDFTLTYNRVTGMTTLSATSDTVSSSWQDYTVEWPAWPGMEFDSVGFFTSSSTTANRGHMENFSQIRDFSVYEPLDFVPEIPSEVSIHHAVELQIPTEDGLYYLIQNSDDLQTWHDVELFMGTGETAIRFFSTREDSRRFFRVFRTDG